MNTAAAPAETASRYCGLTPAVPTDTSAILHRLLTLSGRAREERAADETDPILPRGILRLLLRCMKLRDPSIVLHGQRIAAISSGIAQTLGWDDDQRRQLEVAALLHDLGKIGVSQHILHKPGKLSSEEYDLVTLHHHAAVSLLQALQADAELVTMLTMLYQNFDGSGLEVDSSSSQHLPLGPRILAVADAYDSLSSPKAYRRGMPHEDVIKVLDDQSGSRYDGNIIRTLERWYETDGHCLFQYADPLCEGESSEELAAEQRDEIVVLTQILHVLYQFQSLYDGYFILDSRGNYCVWSDGMTGLSGIPLERVMGRSWKPSDVRLSAITQADREHSKPPEDIVSQVLRNGRSQFGSRICHLSDSQQISVDVYTTAVVEPPRPVEGVVQLFRCKGGVRRQSREYVELKLAATRDPLTGVANRGQLETQLRHLIDDYHNHEGTRPLSAVFLDVDRFKSINDTYGHKSGDQVLVDLTRLLQHDTYSGELIGRYGGEEFVLLCPDTDLQAAVRRAERLRYAISKSSIGGISELTVTSSFGVSTARLGDSVQTLLERADSALYRAKESGRNRTCWEGQDAAAEKVPETPAEDAAPRIVQVDGSFRFTETVSVSTSLELTAMKLNAFLSAGNVRVLHQERGYLKLQCGSLGLLRSWGRTAERQPVSIEIRFETTRTAETTGGTSKTLRFVVVSITPVGRIADAEVFENRCTQLLRELKSYLLCS